MVRGPSDFLSYPTSLSQTLVVAGAIAGARAVAVAGTVAVAGAGVVAAMWPRGGPNGGRRAGGDPWMVRGLRRQRPRHLAESNLTWPVDQRMSGSWWASQVMPSTRGYCPRHESGEFFTVAANVQGCAREFGDVARG